MKEHGILFKGEMVRAILDGRKTQTRRLMTPQPTGDPSKQWPDEDAWSWSCSKARSMVDIRDATGSCCPHGVRGYRLWVRETFKVCDANHWPDLAHACGPDGRIAYYKEGFDRSSGLPWRPSIFMPRWASRITLEITEVRVQRLQEISEDDARAEGCNRNDAAIVIRDGAFDRELGHTARGAYAVLWDSINFKRSPWGSNPFVWAISFRRVQP